MDRASHYRNIYQTKAMDYDLLISKEDYQRNLLPALTALVSLSGAKVVEIGAGTGRFTALLAPLVGSITAFDESAPMLAIAEKKLTASGLRNWALRVASNQKLPATDRSADLCLAGWTLGHLRHWFPDTWVDELTLALSELKRVTKPGGSVVIIETLGSGTETPGAPTAALAQFYSILESEHQFQRMSLRTDFRFDSLDQAERIVRFFFGDEMAERVKRSGSPIVPEWTGIWSLKL